MTPEELLKRAGVVSESDPGAAKVLYEQAAALFRQSGNIPGEAHCYLWQGETAFLDSDYRNARFNFESAMERLEKTSEQPWLSLAAIRLGEIAVLTASDEVAEPYFHQALRTLEGGDEAFLQTRCHMALGSLSLNRSEYDRAWEQYSKARANAERVPLKFHAAICLRALGQIALAQGKSETALRVLGDALRELKDLKMISARLEEGTCYEHLGDLFTREGWEGVLEHYQEAQARFSQFGEGPRVKRLCSKIARVHARTDQGRDDSG